MSPARWPLSVRFAVLSIPKDAHPLGADAAEHGQASNYKIWRLAAINPAISGIEAGILRRRTVTDVITSRARGPH